MESNNDDEPNNKNIKENKETKHDQLVSYTLTTNKIKEPMGANWPDSQPVYPKRNKKQKQKVLIWTLIMIKSKSNKSHKLQILNGDT